VKNRPRAKEKTALRSGNICCTNNALDWTRTRTFKDRYRIKNSKYIDKLTANIHTNLELLVEKRM